MKNNLPSIFTHTLSFIAITTAISQSVIAETNAISELAATPDPTNTVYSFRIDKDARFNETFPVQQLTSKHRETKTSRAKSTGTTQKDTEKKLVILHPEIQEIVNTAPKKVLNVIVTMREDIEFPLFPAQDQGVTRNSKQWQDASVRRSQLLQEIKTVRVRNHKALESRLKVVGGSMNFNTHFTLVNAFSAEMTAKDAELLANISNVIHVRPTKGKLRPLNDGNPANNMSVARMPMNLNSDLFFDSPNVPQGGYIGVIDTGVYSEHTLLDEQFASDIYVWDCVNGDDFCDDNGSASWDPDDCFDIGHGTSVATIIQGNNSLGNEHRGTTQFGLDSYKVSSGCSFADVDILDADVVQALETAVVNGDGVVNLSLGGNVSVADGITAEQDLVALAADNAFDAGIIVVAASGNDGVLDCPGCSHKTLTSGAYEIETPFQLYSDSGHGPATDGRIKPDVIAPHCVEAAAITDPNELASFCGTSGSAPFVSSAAMLTRSALDYNVPNVDINEAGYTYAAMHMFARNFGNITDETGSGPVNMRGCGRFWFGKTDIISDNDTVNIPMTLSPSDGNGTMKAAIWWPEAADQNHNDIDLTLIHPSGTTVDESQEISSVFERVSGNSFQASSGTWTLQISGYDIQDGPQEVYFAASAGGCTNDFETL